jgi:hypothetical protein
MASFHTRNLGIPLSAKNSVASSIPAHLHILRGHDHQICLVFESSSTLSAGLLRALHDSGEWTTTGVHPRYRESAL